MYRGISVFVYNFIFNNIIIFLSLVPVDGKKLEEIF